VAGSWHSEVQAAETSVPIWQATTSGGTKNGTAEQHSEILTSASMGIVFIEA
jgi:hypothetical protein